jgi:spoIIIJ-associated protein
MEKEFTGKNVEEAIEKGLAELGLGREEVEIEVISRGSRGVLGIGATDARVRILWGEPTHEVQQKEPEEQTSPVSAVRKEVESGKTPRGADQEVIEVGEEILVQLLEKMGFDASVEAVYEDDLASDGGTRLVFNITVPDDESTARLIGRHGDVIDAMQNILRLMVSHRLKRWVNFAVDVNGYRAHREESLVKLAHRIASQVRETGRGVPLEPMPARERRIIHLALKDDPDVVTQSIGEGERRRVTIVPKQFVS